MGLNRLEDEVGAFTAEPQQSAHHGVDHGEEPIADARGEDDDPQHQLQPDAPKHGAPADALAIGAQ